MEEKILNALLEMYISKDFDEIVDTDIAYAYKDDIYGHL